MTVVPPQWGQSVAEHVASLSLHRSRHQVHRAAAFAVLAMLLGATSQRLGAVDHRRTGLQPAGRRELPGQRHHLADGRRHGDVHRRVLASHTNVYLGIRNDTNVNGQTMTGAAPTAASAAVFRISSTAASSITYIEHARPSGTWCTARRR